MAFSTTITFTVNAVAKVLNRINQDKYSSEYFLRSATESYRAFIRHTTIPAKGSVPKQDRHSVEFIHTVFATPTTAEIVRRIFVAENAPSTDSVTDQQYFMKSFTTVINGDTLQNDLLNWLS